MGADSMVTVPSTDSTIEDTLDTDTVTATAAQSLLMLRDRNPVTEPTTVTPDSTDTPDSTEDTTDTDTDTVTDAPWPLTSRERKATPDTTADTLTDTADIPVTVDSTPATV